MATLNPTIETSNKKPYIEYAKFNSESIHESWNDKTSSIAVRILFTLESIFKSVGSYCAINTGRLILNIGVGFENFWKNLFSKQPLDTPTIEKMEPTPKDVAPVIEREQNPAQQAVEPAALPEVVLQEAEKLEEPTIEEASKIATAAAYFPEIAVGTATLAGIASRFADKLPANLTDVQGILDLKNRAVCRAGFSSPMLQGINSFKQWEIKNFALLTPLIPLLVKITSDALSNKEPSEGITGVAKKFVQAAKNQVSLEEAVFLTTIVTLSLLNPVYGRALGLTSRTFDSSGHLMLKGSLAVFLTRTLNMIKENSGKTLTGLALAFGLLYGVSDFAFIYHTSTICHTASELLAGIGWATGIYAIGKAAAHGISSRFSSNDSATEVPA